MSVLNETQRTMFLRTIEQFDLLESILRPIYSASDTLDEHGTNPVLTELRHLRGWYSMMLRLDEAHVMTVTHKNDPEPYILGKPDGCCRYE